MQGRPSVTIKGTSEHCLAEIDRLCTALKVRGPVPVVAATDRNNEVISMTVVFPTGALPSGAQHVAENN
jgi:hypothetical protein